MSNSKPAPALFAMVATLILCLAATAAPVQGQVSVAATVRPLQFIALAVLGENGSATAVMDSRDSPHHFTLSPGDRLALAGADLILWVGPELETPLTDFLSRPEQARKAVRVSALEEVRLLALDSGETDPHLWLDPDNAIAIAMDLTARVSRLDPANSALYSANLARFVSALDALNAQVTRQLQPFAGRPYLVYHDAYRYFEQRFGLAHTLALVANPEVQPGMRELLGKRQQIRALGARCLILEPGASTDLVSTLTGAGNRLATVTVDPLGHALAAGPEAYTQLILAVAQGFQDCLRLANG